MRCCAASYVVSPWGVWSPSAASTRLLEDAADVKNSSLMPMDILAPPRNELAETFLNSSQRRGFSPAFPRLVRTLLSRLQRVNAFVINMLNGHEYVSRPSS